jgi:hypothetical protein
MSSLPKTRDAELTALLLWRASTDGMELRLHLRRIEDALTGTQQHVQGSEPCIHSFGYHRTPTTGRLASTHTRSMGRTTIPISMQWTSRWD